MAAVCQVYYYREPANLPMKIKNRATWRFNGQIFTNKARTTYLDLTDYTGSCSIVNKNTAAVVATVTVTITSASTGAYTLSLTATETDSLPLNTDLVYDLFFVKAAPEDKMCVMQGVILVDPNYTAA